MAASDDSAVTRKSAEEIALALAADAGARELALAAVAVENDEVDDDEDEYQEYKPEEDDGEEHNVFLENLLIHELAVSHRMMMRVAAQADRFLDRVSPAPEDPRGARTTLEAVRLVGASARLMERFRLGLMTLHKFRPARRSGQRIVTVMWGDELAKLRNRGSGGSSGGEGGGAPPGSGGGPGAPGNGGTPGAASASASRPGLANRGRLANGNPSGDYLAAPRCGARTRAGRPCRQPAMANGRCRLHGGRSTGPRTESGRRRSAEARLVHGCRTAEMIALRSAAARSARRLAALTRTARPAGHGVLRSVSPRPLERRIDREVTNSTKTRISVRPAADRGRRNEPALLFVPIAPSWFQSNDRILAGHEVDRSVSSRPPGSAPVWGLSFPAPAAHLHSVDDGASTHAFALSNLAGRGPAARAAGAGPHARQAAAEEVAPAADPRAAQRPLESGRRSAARAAAAGSAAPAARAAADVRQGLSDADPGVPLAHRIGSIRLFTPLATRDSRSHH